MAKAELSGGLFCGPGGKGHGANPTLENLLTKSIKKKRRNDHCTELSNKKEGVVDRRRHGELGKERT